MSCFCQHDFFNGDLCLVSVNMISLMETCVCCFCQHDFFNGDLCLVSVNMISLMETCVLFLST